MFPFSPQRPPGPPSPQRPRNPYRPQRPQIMQRPPRQTHPFGLMGPPPPQQQPQQKQTVSNLMSMFQTPEGNFDLQKITGTVQQVSQLYGHISPLITKFIKR